MKYTIQKGDTLSNIASKLLDPSLGLTYRDIAGWNNISDPNVIFAGQVLDIPDSVVNPNIIFGQQPGPAGAQITQPSAAPSLPSMPSSMPSAGVFQTAPTTPAAVATPTSNTILGMQPKTIMYVGLGLIALLAVLGMKKKK